MGTRQRAWWEIVNSIRTLLGSIEHRCDAILSFHMAHASKIILNSCMRTLQPTRKLQRLQISCCTYPVSARTPRGHATGLSIRLISLAAMNNNKYDLATTTCDNCSRCCRRIDLFGTARRCPFSIPYSVVVGKHSREFPSSLLNSDPRQRFADASGTHVTKLARLLPAIVRVEHPENTAPKTDRSMAPVSVEVERKWTTTFL